MAVPTTSKIIYLDNVNLKPTNANTFIKNVMKDVGYPCNIELAKIIGKKCDD